MVYPKLSKLFIEIEAMDRLAKIPAINVVGSKGYIPIQYWNGTGYSFDMVNSANPAWAVYSILTNVRFGLGIDPANIDYTSFTEWASYCDDWVKHPEHLADSTYDEPRLRVNGIFDQKNMNAWDAIDQIAQVGRARLSLMGSIYYVRVNKPEEPAAVVSAASYDEDSMSVEWIDDQGKPDIFILEFHNKDDQYKKDSVEVVTEDLSSDPTLAQELNVQTVFVPFITSRSQALREAKIRLKTARAITKKYSWDMDVEGIDLEPGDVILLQSESNRLAYGSKVDSVDAVAETITLDRDIELSTSVYSGADARICVRNNSTNVMHQLSVLGPWDTETDTFNVLGIGATAATILGSLSSGDPVMVGRYEIDLELVKLEEVNVGDDQRMSLVGFDYDEAIFDEEIEADAPGTEDVTGDGSNSPPPPLSSIDLDDYW
jgi:hypothetical protein